MKEEAIVIPDLIEPISAWRIWRIRKKSEEEKGFRLGPVYPSTYLGEDAWEKPGSACCRVRNHEMGVLIPSSFCSCGFYAKKDLKPLLEEFWYEIARSAKYRKPVSSFVIGRVALWGKVIEHKDGYRAQFVWPTSMIVPWILPKTPIFRYVSRRKLARMCGALQTHYRVPVVPLGMPFSFEKIYAYRPDTANNLLNILFEEIASKIKI